MTPVPNYKFLPGVSHTNCSAQAAEAACEGPEGGQAERAPWFGEAALRGLSVILCEKCVPGMWSSEYVAFKGLGSCE